MSEERQNKRIAVFMRITKSGKGAIVNLPRHYIYFDWHDLEEFVDGNQFYIKGTVYRKKRGDEKNDKE